MHALLGVILGLFYIHSLWGTYLGSQESDPASLISNVSTLYGDYTEIEVDLTVPAPDSLMLSRFYSSQDLPHIASFGGWRFNPHCFLVKDEGTSIHIGTSEGSILTYRGSFDSKNRSLFLIDSSGIANTARGSPSAKTNLRNNRLYFDPQTNTFELSLSSGGKRFYVAHNEDLYLLTLEILPSGNKIFYTFDSLGRLTLIKETNGSETEELAWISLHYDQNVCAKTSDGKRVDYVFQQGLTQVLREEKPSLLYTYKTVEGKLLLIKKELPEGRCIQIEYDSAHKVKTIATPLGIEASFLYGPGWTQITGPGQKKTLHHFDSNHQLTSIEQYLEGSLYRIHKKTWGKEKEATYLLSSSVEDGSGHIFYHNAFTYDESSGNLLEIREYGNFTGVSGEPFIIDSQGHSAQEAHLKKYAYTFSKDTDEIFEISGEGSGIKSFYKKGTNLLIKKCIVSFSEIKKRYFYTYNDDAVLIEVITDDGSDPEKNSLKGVHERHITTIFPKATFPYVGAPEVIEEKYFDLISKKEVLLKRTVYHFDAQGYPISEAIYDANTEFRYSIDKAYEQGLLVLETDPIGNTTHYRYDANGNLILETHSNSGLVLAYTYDVKNRKVHTSIQDGEGLCLETHISYDLAGNKISETDQFGNQTSYVYDDLRRLIQKKDPSGLIHTYAYDLFDHVMIWIDAQGDMITQSSNIYGSPTHIQYPDGTQELFKYTLSGSLERHLKKNGLTELFDYDYMGRLTSIYEWTRQQKRHLKKYYEYDAFHLIGEGVNKEKKISYSYDGAGRIEKIDDGCLPITLIYDPLGRSKSLKKELASDSFTLEIQEYDLLNRVIEKRTEDSKGRVFLKSRYTYTSAGELFQIIGYPHNQESILLEYQYDGLGRLSKISNASHQAVTMIYEDDYIFPSGERGQKSIFTDAVGNQTEEFYLTGRCVKTLKKDASGSVLRRNESFYDSRGRKILEKGPNNYEMQWSFNQGSQLEAITYGKDSLPTTFRYNAYGELSAQQCPGFKNPICYEYDEYGDLSKITYPGAEHQISYEEDRQISTVNLTSFQKLYCSTQKKWKSERMIDPTVPYCTYDHSAGCYDLQYANFNSEGKICRLLVNNGSYIEYAYEGPFVKSISRSQSYRAEKLYTYTILERDLMGNLIAEQLPGKIGLRHQKWDLNARKQEITTDFSLHQVLEYDLLGNITKQQAMLDDTTEILEYSYNALSELISEKGKHTYTYDALGNRTQKDQNFYTVNDSNHLKNAENISYTFDLCGNLSSKTVEGKTWQYTYDALGRLIAVECPDQSKITFTYALDGRRLTKKIGRKGAYQEIFQYLYLGQTEIGCLRGYSPMQLKVPSDPNQPETSPCIAIEIRGTLYVPLYDLQGNIICLLDKDRNIVESYRYSAFGEEEIFNASGEKIPKSAIGNPWRYKGKRIDEETGLIYFGKRYYDPQIGRWISPDPAGPLDSPNLFLFSKNNPIIYMDYFGLSSEQSESQRQFYQSVPCECGYCVRNEGFCHCRLGQYNFPDCGCLGIHCDHKNKINLMHMAGGIGHGAVDFIMSSLHDLHTATAYMGSAEMDLIASERLEMIGAIEQSHTAQMGAVEAWIMDFLPIDSSSELYQTARSHTNLGLQAASLIAGGYGAVKGVMAFNRLAKMPVQVVKIGSAVFEDVLRVGDFKYTNTAAKHFGEFVKRGPNAGKLSRPYMNSPLTVNEIMSARQPIPDPRKVPGSVRWDVPGTFRGNEGTWELVLHPENKIIYHFNFK